MSDEAQTITEVDAATRAIETTISACLAAGTNRCVLAAACVWSGVNEMSEVTSAESAAAALRTIADQIAPPMDVPRTRNAGLADRAPIANMGAHVRTANGSKQEATEGSEHVAGNSEIAGEIVSEAIDLLDQGHTTQARALLMALRVRSFRDPRRRRPTSARISDLRVRV